jgi:pimeloyl-ACP methyl ester carboxylesterase
MWRMKQVVRGAVVALMLGGAAGVAAIPAAIATDQPHNVAHPARMEVIHVPSGGVAINGIAYLAAGAGAHPTVLLFHGLPGNEKNLDLAQAIRRAGWNVVTINYRGSWGSPGNFRFAQNLEDADALLAYVRAPAIAAKLGIDTGKLVLMGHSMGGWVTALTAAHDKRLAGAVMISPGNLGRLGGLPRDKAAAFMRDNGMEALAGTSPEIMADELIANGDRFDMMRAGPALAGVPVLMLTSDDGGAPMADALVAGIRGAGGTQASTVHAATDHSWSDARIRLESEIIDWLAGLK